jgi:hypothetical protein
MTNKGLSKYVNIYFASILTIAVLWTYFGNDRINVYGPVFFMIFSCPPLFSINYILHYQIMKDLKIS